MPLSVVPMGIKDPFEMLPVGTFVFKVKEAADGMFGKDEAKQTYVIQVVHEVVEPASHAGMEQEETFFIGINEDANQVKTGKLQADPEANLPETWIVRAAQFKKYCATHGINIEGMEIPVILQQLAGKRIMGKVIHKGAMRDGQPLLREGTQEQMINARVDRWFAEGSVPAGISENQAAVTPAATPGAGPRPGPAAGPRPAGAPTGPATTAAPAAAAPPPARPALKRLGK